MLESLQKEITHCRHCDRLVRHRESIAREKRKSFAQEEYWGRAVPGFGDANARVIIVGLAPAAHGANRTGRIFTGDRSGDWLYEALHRFGFANQATSQSREDGLVLRETYVTCAVHCAPPDNKPLPSELQSCTQTFLARELQVFQATTQVVICLGAVAAESVLKLLAPQLKPRPKFTHGKELLLPSGVRVLFSYHPSQQNTFTGKLTRPMFHAIFERARAIISLQQEAHHGET
jgi:uracil-DNA glycosylase family 4